MKDMKNMTNQGGSQGDKSKPSSRPPDEEPNPSRKEPESTKQPTREEPETSKQPGRPTPSGVPSEGRRAEGVYEDKSRRQGTGAIPNPDNQDDADEIDGEQGIGGGQFRRDLISPIRNPE